ncbi:plc-like phosphodiesterase [Stemphylium lycopersici]|nr:plc-like phosphodiesterase [Stemphylium lycopersici]
MPSKGIKCFAYIAADGVEIEFTVPKQNIKRNEQRQFLADHLEIESSNLPLFKFIGNFEFIVRRNGRELTKQWVAINSITGKLEEGTMVNMEQTPAIFTDDVVITYGFYDAGPGLAELPKQHQCYVTVTKNYENWMRDVIPQCSDKSNRPFHKMVLPSSHDIGMNNMASSLSLLRNAGTGIIKEVLGRSLPHAFTILNKIGDGAINHIAPDIIRALAITQKDTLDAILNIGARYFEFRPAKCHRQMQKVSPLEDTWYFQHGAIPGMPYRVLLDHILRFLAAHKDEIIVVHNRWDGVPADCPRPNDDELRDVLNPLLHGKDIKIGNQDDMMHKSIRDLRNEHKRLILLKDCAQASNYDDEANATLTGDSMVTKLHAMCEDPPRGNPITLLQCQATATNIRDVIVASVLDSDVSTSPILATKPVCDAKILPLLRGEMGRKLMREEGVVVVLNDFFDGATADVAIGLCRERLG